MNTNLFFKLFTTCIVSKGKNKSIILDLQREKFTAIPDTMHDVIEEFKNRKTIEDIYTLYGIDNKTIIDEYLEFLINNDFGFLADSNEFDLFIDIENSFEIATDISNCIIEVSNTTLLNFEESINSLEKLLCKNIQLICYEEVSISVLKRVLKATRNIDFKSIELVLKYSDEVFNFIPLIDQHNFRITELTLHSTFGRNKELNDCTFSIVYLDYEIKNFANCGVIDSSNFGVNKDKVLESLNHNSCLNKKISIDKDGNIKNCPSMAEIFGNIKETNLEDALNQLNFKKYWNINKDQIEVCKDCEFRHICTDCRAYTERTDFEGDIDLSKPLKCGYNPYTNEWAEWSTNPLKQKAIEYYGMQDLVKKN
ncbi:grasp-with-spasm system SPASM domain peptide maturase [Flavobacterium sp.]|jgi:SPASM domain peptide maturase of grasp-with-spasm system|uniref:grasp-with-spasm system SPASM domain peptide maturase n=1 Tax=Flavobacterium sp. TaxID=239 RepID=UPI0037C040AF